MIKRYLHFHITIIFIIVSFLMSSCTIETYATKKINADTEILSYLSDNKIDNTKFPSGLIFIPIESGCGEKARVGDKVAFHYKGYFLSGEIFDSSYDKSYPLIVGLGNGQLIKGLEESLLLMNKGAKAKFILPFYLAYDNMENAPVPPYSNLIFEIELLDINVKK